MEKRKKNNFDLKKEYKESWNYIKYSKNFIWYVVFIFLIFALIGFFLPVPEAIENEIIKMLKELIAQTENLSQSELISYIFLNNLETSFLGMCLGIFFGIFPIILTIVNGYLLGFVAMMSVSAEGGFVLLRLLPHGIFEIPAVFISLGLGLKLGTFIFQRKKLKFLKENFIKSLKVFLLIVIPLLIIAGIIEGCLVFWVK